MNSTVRTACERAIDAAPDLEGRNFLKELDFTAASSSCPSSNWGPRSRSRSACGARYPDSLGKNIALIFEKTSTRTRAAFEVAAHDQGAHVTYLGPVRRSLGRKESMEDTARVLGRMFDGDRVPGLRPGTG